MKSVFVVATLVAFSGHLLYASDDSVTRRSLRGVKAFDVVIEAKDDNALGLTREGLQTDVELRCRQAGIKLEKVTEPFLYVAVTAQELTSAPSGRSMNAFALFVEVDSNRRYYCAGLPTHWRLRRRGQLERWSLVQRGTFRDLAGKPCATWLKSS
jgi:hypothetical protein